MSEGLLSGFDFQKRAKLERTAPTVDVVSPGSAGLPAFFEIDDDNEEQPYVEKKAKPDEISVKKHYVTFSEVFLIWRSWEKCSRCKKDIEDEVVELPSTGDYTCPHTQVKEYKQISDKCMSGQGIIIAKENFNLKSGERLTHLEWVEGSPEKIQEQKDKKNKESVYPPNPSAIFSAPYK